MNALGDLVLCSQVMRLASTGVSLSQRCDKAIMHAVVCATVGVQDTAWRIEFALGVIWLDFLRWI